MLFGYEEARPLVSLQRLSAGDLEETPPSDTQQVLTALRITETNALIKVADNIHRRHTGSRKHPNHNSPASVTSTRRSRKSLRDLDHERLQNMCVVGLRKDKRDARAVRECESRSHCAVKRVWSS
ncbi:uncharacterized protein LOC122574485 [Bombus pyrosoma]|uniref:uncharacterized protein LOC122574485 n=1 Tax=Bombus pyrosoma TaxID=396416 RepID=UPI001CB981D7|nr:uncharacterized protein LOC122574485 [Bombus pyrosoma]